MQTHTLSPTDASDLFRGEPHDYIDVGAGRAAYRRVGTGPDVLFVHGWPVSGATFRRLLPHLSQHLTCHVVDLPGAGSSQFERSHEITFAQHITSVRRIIDHLDDRGLAGADLAVVGHDSGGLISRHAVVGDPRVRALGLIDTEPLKLNWRFTSFLMAGRLPGFGAGLGWVAGRSRLRRNGFVFGDAFSDRSLLDGEFDEFFLQPATEDPDLRWAATQGIRSFDRQLIQDLPNVHGALDMPVHLVWGAENKFFPVERAREMVETFPNATLTEIRGAGLFSHEESPASVAQALLPTLVR